MAIAVCQCLKEFWTQHGENEEVALVQSFNTERGTRRAEASYAQVYHWLQELRRALNVQNDEWTAVGINLTPFSLEETALMLLVAEQRRWMYVPIDMELPLVRQLSLLRSAGARRLVTTVGSPLTRLIAETGEVDVKTIDLTSNPFQPVQVAAFGRNHLHAEEEKEQRECIHRRLNGNKEVEEKDFVAPLYVLFTSGTTGRPRGVFGTREGAWTRLEWMWKTYPFARSTSGRTSERVVRATKLSFVDSVWEILGAFLAHVPLVHLQSPRHDTGSSRLTPFQLKSVVLDDSTRFLELVRDEKVTRFTAVPSVLEMLLLQTTAKDRQSALSGLRYVLSSGESLQLHVLQQFTANLPDVAILNLYGSTEMSGDVTCMELKAPLLAAQIAQWQQYGVPIASLDRRGVIGTETTLLLVSDDLGKNVPVSIDESSILLWSDRTTEFKRSTDTRGILYVSGPLLAFGYVGHDDVFVHLEESHGCQNDSKQLPVVQPRRWVCTGDICLVNQGHLYFCGRKDNAVKIHGQRVYLEAVERAVVAALKETVIDPQHDDDYQVIAFMTTKNVSKYALVQQRIVACLISSNARNSIAARYPSMRALHAWIAEHYGTTHIPHELLVVPSTAVTRLAHGKVDRRALRLFVEAEDINPELLTSLKTSNKDKDTTEMLLVKLVTETLGISLSDGGFEAVRARTFAELGGNSLLATLFVHEFRQTFGTLSLSAHILLDMTLDQVLLIVDSERGKCLQQSRTRNDEEPKRDEVKRRKTINHVLSTESTDNANIGRQRRSQQDELTFFSRYNQTSMEVKGIYLPTCYISSANQTVPTSSLSLSWELRNGWRVDLGKCIDASPLVVQRRNHEGAVSSTWAIVGSHSYQLICVDVEAAGREIWRVTLDNRIEASAALSIKHEMVYVGTYAGSLFALDLQSGETLWKFKAGGTIKASVVVMDQQKLVVCGAYDHKLYGLDAVTSQQRWIVDAHGSIFSTPLYCAWSEQLFAASTNGNLVALTSASSALDKFCSIKEQWRLQLPAPVFAGLNADNTSKTLIVGCADGQLYGVTMSSGVVRWHFTTEKPIFSSPCVYRSGFVVFGSHDGKLRKVNCHTGELAWATSLNGAVFASPTVVRLTAELSNLWSRNRRAVSEENCDLVCCVTTTTGYLYFCDENTGSIIYHTDNSSGKQPPINANNTETHGDLGPLFSSPVLVYSWCLLGTRTNFLYGFELTST